MTNEATEQAPHREQGDDPAKRPSGVPEAPNPAAQNARIEALEAEVLVLNERIAWLARRQASPSEFGSSPEGVELTADCQLHAADGFYELEYDAEGRPYRWTGPSHIFGAELLLDRNAPRRLTLSLGAACSDESLEGIRAFVDGQEIAVERRDESENGYITIAGVIPQADRAGPIRLWFFVPKVVAPCETDPLSGDERKLGVAFASVAIG